MTRAIIAASLSLIVMGASASAGTRVIAGSNGPITINQSNTTVYNRGTISGGGSTGLTVKGSNNTVVNSGTISGTTGVSMSGGSSSFTNNGTVRASSTGGSSSSAVGVSQGN